MRSTLIMLLLTGGKWKNVRCERLSPIMGGIQAFADGASSRRCSMVSKRILAYSTDLSCAQLYFRPKFPAFSAALTTFNFSGKCSFILSQEFIIFWSAGEIGNPTKGTLGAREIGKSARILLDIVANLSEEAQSASARISQKMYDETRKWDIPP